jgi:hypothetical protein
VILRRIVFGEAKPGFPNFAKVLQPLDESVAYCNRTGPLEHDRVTDYALTIPALGFDFVHPTPLAFVSSAPPAGDSLGIFAWHHSYLYAQGTIAAGLDPVHVEAARLCNAIYAKPGTLLESWEHQATTAGVYWAISRQGGRAYVVFRGSDTLLDWLRDLIGINVQVMLNRIFSHYHFGPMWDGFLIGMDETWAAVRSLISDADEVVFTGHSLGADRADIAAGFAVLERKAP